MTPDLQSLGLFIAGSLALLVIPGPAVAYVVTRSASQGLRAGLVSIAGLHVGTLVHIVSAVLGVSALLAASSHAYSIVRYLGAGYLIYLGFRAYRSRQPMTLSADGNRPSLRRTFWEGAIVNTLNPKAALFFVAFLPQFVANDALNPAFQLLLLGLVFLALGAVTDGVYALLAGSLAQKYRKRAGHSNRLQKAAGLAYVGLGISAAIAGLERP